MQIQPTVQSRVASMDAQKANRLQVVESLPEPAEDGDMVLLQNILHVRADGFWRNIDDNVMAHIQSLQERLDVLEGEGS